MIAGADDVVAIHGDLQRRQLGVAADPLGDSLVYRHPRAHVGPFGLLGMLAAHERRGRPGMLPAGVSLVRARMIIQSGQHQRVIPEGLQRLQGGGKRESRALCLRRPVEHVGPVAEVHRRESRGRLRRCAQRGDHRVEEWQRHRRAHSVKERPTGQRFLCDHHWNSPCTPPNSYSTAPRSS